VVGLEVHAQVTATNAKLFSGAATAFGAEPNTQVSLVDAAMPGMLPVPNRECIRQAVRTGMALDAVINRWSRFDRKNYFYADPAAGLSDQPALPSAGRRGRGRDPARREGREFAPSRSASSASMSSRTRAS
jgi:Asp-tRNA(Asn)/Glu-tRNA(Gln) amidotransferase B subunit